ncbi:MAG: ribonuclease H family protein [Bacteroidales bacterium]|nr:ribonuclease H family protein [Bacteroidales bacterium]
MAKAKQKWYVVWRGKQPGIYATWADCEAQVKGAKNELYKAFATLQEAEEAYAGNPYDYMKPRHPKAMPAADMTAASSAAMPQRPAAAPPGCPPPPPTDRHDTVLPLPPAVTADAWAVDAACAHNPGPMEYRGIDLRTGAVVFHFGPIYGTNNIGEFLAIVHAMALMMQRGERRTIYSDSVNAMSWVKQRCCKSKLEQNARSQQAWQLIERAVAWLQSHDVKPFPLRKWETHLWGEIPADFGRK